MRGRLDERFAASAALHSALASVPWPAVLDARHSPWVRADRMVWGELPLTALPGLHEPAEALAELATSAELRNPNQAIHSDLSGNLLFVDGLPPAVIDFSPYYRPVAYADGILAADLLLWGDADREVLEYVEPPYVARVVLFRLLSALEEPLPDFERAIRTLTD
jgi:hypothetical protein